MRSIFLRFIIVCPLALTLSVPGTAQAGPPGKSDVATDKARELHMEADRLYKQGDYARAHVSYIAAWTLKRHWQIAGNLGETEVQLGLYRDAAEHLAYFIRNLPDPSSPEGSERMAVAKRLYQKARSKIGTLHVTVDMPSAEVVVDGNTVGKVPLEDPVFVEPGHHTIEARRGAKLTTAEVDVAAGDERRLALTLTVPHGVARPPSTLAPPHIGWIIATGVLGVGGLAAGAGLTAAANGKASQVQQLQSGQSSSCFAPGASSASRCTSLHDAASSKATLSNAAEASFLVGGAFALATAGLGIWTAVSPKAGPVRAAPTVGAGEVGVVVQGVW